jgi:hypothetical protein
VADFDPPPDHSFDYYFTLVLLSTHLNFSNEAFLPFIRNTELRHPRYLLYDLSTPQSLERNLRCLRSLGPGFSTTVNLDAFAHSRTTEAAARWVVDSITLNAYATATSNIKNAQPLNVQCERGYKFSPVTLKRKRVILSGRPNYSVWYGESEAFRLNVLIAEAKGGAKGSNPIPQLLGYMGLYLAMCIVLYLGKLIGMKGCIRRERKNEQTRNWGVYGMAYTGSVWHLLKISHDSKVSWLISAKSTILIYTSGRNLLLSAVGALSSSRSVCWCGCCGGQLPSP